MMSIHLATGCESVLDLMYTVLTVVCDVFGHAITQHVTYQIMKTYLIIQF